MPKRRDDLKKSEVVGIRMTTDLRERFDRARLAGAFRSSAESTFLAYLIEIGLAKYENVILPQERDDVVTTILPQERVESDIKLKKGVKTKVA